MWHHVHQVVDKKREKYGAKYGAMGLESHPQHKHIETNPFGMILLVKLED
jgi:hypothetical protein